MFFIIIKKKKTRRAFIFSLVFRYKNRKWATTSSISMSLSVHLSCRKGKCFFWMYFESKLISIYPINPRVSLNSSRPKPESNVRTIVEKEKRKREKVTVFVVVAIMKSYVYDAPMRRAGCRKPIALLLKEMSE